VLWDRLSQAGDGAGGGEGMSYLSVCGRSLKAAAVHIKRVE